MRNLFLIGLLSISMVSYAGCIDRFFDMFSNKSHTSVVEKLHTGVKANIAIGKKDLEVEVLDIAVTKIKVKDSSGKKYWIKTNKVQSIKILSVSKSAKGLREKHWAKFEQLQDKLWEEHQSFFRLKLDDYRKMSPSEKGAELNRLDEALQTLIDVKFRSRRIGIHFNLNGGMPLLYMQAGGIRHGRGDIGNMYGNFNHDELVYFFRSDNTGILSPLSERNPKQLTGGRYGNVLILFDLDDPHLQLMQENGTIIKENLITMTFNERLTKNRIGIPSDAFITPPISVFKPFNGRITRGEETFINMSWLLILLEKYNIQS